MTAKRKKKARIEPYFQRGDIVSYHGDCREIAAQLPEKSCDLLIVDPPYGMNKENDGVANDNKHKEKLDAFQMEWWHACRPALKDNASVYIWGNAEDLWRLWYAGGLRDSERMTLRNEIVWSKGTGQGRNSELHRMYATASERCLFFMLGEQGFNTNADNYWQGWEPIRSYLDNERKKMGWTAEDIKRITGVGMFSHWFTESQFVFITKEHYEALQKAAKKDSFKRKYESLKRKYESLKDEFYATRAYFDNTHDNMTDIWEYPSVSGDARWSHPTAKPISIMERCIKSSCPPGGTVLDPMMGCGPVLSAAKKLGRKAIGIELIEKWCKNAKRNVFGVRQRKRKMVRGRRKKR